MISRIHTQKSKYKWLLKERKGEKKEEKMFNLTHKRCKLRPHKVSFFFPFLRLAKFYKLDDINTGEVMGKQVLSYIIGRNMIQDNL